MKTNLIISPLKPIYLHPLIALLSFNPMKDTRYNGSRWAPEERRYGRDDLSQFCLQLEEHYSLGFHLHTSFSKTDDI